MANELLSGSLLPMVAIMSGAAAVGFALTSGFAEHPVWSWMVFSGELKCWAAIEWPALLLLFWLMRRMSAVQMTTRFLLAPLITNLIGLVLLRPTVSFRAGLGLVLIAGGAGWLLFSEESESERDSLPPLFASNE